MKIVEMNENKLKLLILMKPILAPLTITITTTLSLYLDNYFLAKIRKKKIL